MLLQFSVVEHSLCRVIVCLLAILQSSLPLLSCEHSGAMTHCACLDACIDVIMPPSFCSQNVKECLMSYR